MSKKVNKGFHQTSSKIKSIANLLMGEDGHAWEVEEIRFTDKTGGSSAKIVCGYVKENGKWVFKCVPA